MALNFKNIFNGLKIRAKAVLTSDSQGELEVDSVNAKLNFHNGTTRSPVVTEAHTASLTNKNLVDTSVVIADAADSTKQIKFDAAGTTGTSTTLLGSQTTDKTLTLPDATDTLVGKATTDTLTNKTIDANGTGNSISNLETADLAAGVLNTSTTMVGASDTQVPSALAIKTYVDNGLAGQNQASEISNVPAGNIAATDVQAAINELDTEKAKVAGDLAQSFSVLRSEVASATDATTTGSNASLAAFTQGIIRLTNASLVSLANIPAGNSGQQLEIINRTGAQFSIIDSASAIGTAADRIFTGSGAAIDLAADASLLFEYDATSARWQIIGGSGGGSATSAVDTVFNINDFTDPTKQINFDAGGTTGTKTTIAAAQTANRTLTLPDLTDTLVSKTSTDTLTNKTLTAPVISSISNTGTLTLPTSTDTLVGRDTTDTLTNKTISGASNTISNVSLTTAVTGVLPEANGGTNQSTYATGDILYASGTNTLAKLAAGTESKTLRILSGIPAWGEYDPNNLLVNPSFEDSALTGWTCTTGTCTSTNTSGEFSDGLRAYKVALSAQAMNVSQSVNTLTGSTTQYVIGVNYRVPATMADFQICTLIAGSEKTCVPSANLILDDAFHSIEIPEVITPGSSVGIKFKTTSSYTANAYFDKAYIKQGIGSQNLALDNVYSAKVSGTGVVSNESGNSSLNWIEGNCTNANPSVCTFVTGVFTVAPNCQATQASSSSVFATVSDSGITSIAIYRKDDAGTPNSAPFTLTCQKSGNDYLAASAAVYSQASANYDWTSYTPTFNGFGTPTSVEVQHRRVGSNLEIRGRFIAGTTTAAEARIGLPSSLTTADTVKIPSIAPMGSYIRNNNGTAANKGGMILVEPSVTYITLGDLGTFSGSTVDPFVKIASTSGVIASGDRLGFFVSVPIAGWSNSSSIVGTFVGTPKVPGLDGNVDTFSVSYGTTNATTVCSASPCSYLDQIGTAVSSVTRTGSGAYSLNTARTYSKLKCSLTANGTTVLSMTTQSSAMSCSSCSALAFTTGRPFNETAGDSYGVLFCQGSY